MNYSDLTTALGNIFTVPIVTAGSATPSANPAFNTILPRAINYAEQRIQRDSELDPVAGKAAGGATTAATIGTIALPTGMIIMETATVFAPTMAMVLQLASRQFINSAILGTGVPRFIAAIDGVDMLLAPTPDDAYPIQFYGTFLATPLSATNASNWVSTDFPDLYLAAAAIFMAGWQRDFGSESDDPTKALSWTKVYEDQKRLAVEQQARRQFRGAGWTGLARPVVAGPQAGG